MNVIKQILDLGTQSDPVANKHIRFSNSIALIVCGFIVQNAALAIYYDRPILIVVYICHFVLIALSLFFNYRGKRVLASTWFSVVAIVFVPFSAIVFTLESFNFVFLSLIIFLQFFLFSAAEKKYIIIFSVIAALCIVLSVLWQQLALPSLLFVPKGLLNAQRLNSLIGIPILSAAFGLYAFTTINKAEREVAKEKDKTEQLLLNVLPQAIVERFKSDRSFFAEGYPSVTVLFADIAGFTLLSEKIKPEELVKFLNDIFSKFDELTEIFGLEKIKTIGDAYMVAGGVPVPSEDHLPRICQMALKMQEAIRDIKSPGGEPLRMRIGISTGPVTAGVIGVKKFIYDLWGDTVNTAAAWNRIQKAVLSR
jgi:adenylate cyclase